MTIIKRMKLKGFKSFANPTILNFEDGFNTIVGANGTGKSNVFDALCFVLGRISSKGLRADKLGNLVFNGGKNLKASKEAEVDLFLSNEDRELLNVELDEIKISRVVKKDGQSTYLLNNNKVTRTEIVEILKRASIDPDGYNIILQGDITRIVNMSPIERRELIEEISNISGYEEKREKALKKLEKIDQGLKEADLLMEEKTKYLKELKSEKDQAEKYHQVKEDLRFNSILLVKSKLIKNANLKKSKEEELEKNEDLYKSHKGKLDEIEGNIKNIEIQIGEIEKEIEIKSHNDFISVTNKITALEAEVQKLKEKNADYKKQIEEIKSRNLGIVENLKENKNKKINLDLDIKNLNLEKDKLSKEISILETKIASLKKGVSSESFEKMDELELKLEELSKKKYEKDLIRQDNSIQIEKLNTKLEHLQDDMSKIEGMVTENKEKVKDLEKYRSELKKIIISVSKRANLDSEISAKIANLLKEQNILNEDFAKLQMKASAADAFISNNKAVEVILAFKRTDQNIHGTIFDLASSNSKYSLALETAAGKSLYNIVVNDDNTAVKYINYLKEKRIGNATFLPLNKINVKYKLDDSVLNKKGVIDYALNLLNYDKKYENIFNLVFADTLIIEKIELAKSIGIGDYRMVTLDGDMAAKSGAMSGGFKSKKGGMGVFKDEQDSKKLESISKRLDTLNSSISHLREEKEDNERALYDDRQRKNELEGEVIKLEKLLSIEGKDTQSIDREIEAILSDRVVIENSLKKISRDIKEIDNDFAILQEEKSKLRQISATGSLMKDIANFEDSRDKLRNQFLAVSSKLDAKSIEIRSVLEPESINLSKILKDNELALENLKKSVSSLSETIKKHELELKDLKIREKELSKDYKQYIEKRDLLKEDRIKEEEKYEKEFAKFDKVKEKGAQLRYAIGEYETLSSTLNDEMKFLYQELRAEFIEKNADENEIILGESKINDLIVMVDEKLTKTQIDVKELQNKVNNLKTRMNGFGSINMKAVEIYDKLNEEFNKLLDKRQTLNVEKDEILSFIAEMDEKKKERFMETFVKLRDFFIDIFSKLSTKGEVELNVENEKDLFNSGVEIRVRLSKNNYLDIKSLSGGEKTITAVAFIFAVQEFNPASFYIFDEVDAALDIMNCEKLGKLIRDSANKAQYIVVSHSEYLIQSAQSIYGVTMDENKISDVVSLDLKNVADYMDLEET